MKKIVTIISTFISIIFISLLIPIDSCHSAEIINITNFKENQKINKVNALKLPFILLNRELNEYNIKNDFETTVHYNKRKDSLNSILKNRRIIISQYFDKTSYIVDSGKYIIKLQPYEMRTPFRSKNKRITMEIRYKFELSKFEILQQNQMPVNPDKDEYYKKYSGDYQGYKKKYQDAVEFNDSMKLFIIYEIKCPIENAKAINKLRCDILFSINSYDDYKYTDAADDTPTYDINYYEQYITGKLEFKNYKIYEVRIFNDATNELLYSRNFEN